MSHMERAEIDRQASEADCDPGAEASVAASRLLVATDAWHPQVNGVVRTLDTTIATLEKFGARTTVLHPGSFHHFPAPWYPEVAISFGRMQRIVDRVVRQVRPRWIHIATEAPVGQAMRRYCLRHGLRFTTAYHTKFPEYVQRYIGLPVWVGYQYLRWFHRPSSRVLVATESMRSLLRTQRFTNSIEIWSRGVDAEVFRPLPREPRDKPVCLYVGRVSVEKNIEEFLRADVDCHKVVVGDGPARKALEQAWPDVEFTGHKHGPELARAYSDADMFVFPSTTDTFGMVLLEALACGLPIAAHPVPGPADIIRNDAGVGCLHADLSTAIRTALHDSDRGRCRQWALRYSWENCTEQFLEHLVDADARSSLPKAAGRAATSGALAR